MDRGANPGRAGGCRERGRDLRAGGREAPAREEGEACAPEPARGCEADTGHRLPGVPAQATRPRGRGTDGPTDGAACRRRPAMFSRSSRKRLSSRSVSVPRPSGADPGYPGALASTPAQAFSAGLTAHLWPQVSRPRGRGCGPSSRVRSEGTEGVKSDSPLPARANREP